MTLRLALQLRIATLLVTLLVVAVSVAYSIAAGVSPGEIVSWLGVAGSFLLTGFVAWAQRPGNRMGPLMVGLGNCILLSVFAESLWPILVPFGLLMFTLSSALLGYLILAYPSGELRSAANRWLVACTAVLIGLPRFLRLFSTDPTASGSTRENPFLFIHDQAFATTIATVPYVIDIVVLSVFVAFVVTRWVRASGPTRRTLSPVLIPTLGLLIVLLGDATSIVLVASAAVREFFEAAQLLVRAVIPVGFLIGLMRTQTARSAIADLVVELGSAPAPARLRDALANALGDPTLVVGYWSASSRGFIDSEGTVLALPGEDSGRAVTRLERAGLPLAAIVHDPVLLEEPGLVASVATALRLAVENERLHREVEAQLVEVRASRARIVEAGDRERKRVERNLHDGAQQRLVSLILALRLARAKLGVDADPALRLSLEQASAEATAAMAELRELARGIHPQILSEAGLEPALQSLADRSPIAVSVDSGTAERFADSIEGTAYYVVSEALANVAKYAGATRAVVRTAWVGGSLTVEVADDGIGGADSAAGSGLRGLADRLAAVGGTMEVVSPAGGGTRLLARMPAAEAATLPG